MTHFKSLTCTIHISLFRSQVWTVDKMTNEESSPDFCAVNDPDQAILQASPVMSLQAMRKQWAQQVTVQRFPRADETNVRSPESTHGQRQ